MRQTVTVSPADLGGLSREAFEGQETTSTSSSFEHRSVAARRCTGSGMGLGDPDPVIGNALYDASAFDGGRLLGLFAVPPAATYRSRPWPGPGRADTEVGT